jgi:hypothetical protein
MLIENEIVGNETQQREKGVKQMGAQGASRQKKEYEWMDRT